MTLDKRRTLLVVLVPALVLLILASRPWARGEARDVLASRVVEVTGAGAAPGVIGATVVAVLALLAMMTGGRVIRAGSGAGLVLAALGAVALTARAALRPVDVVRDAVSRELARTTAPDATGTTTAWAWTALAAAVVLAAAAVVAAVSSRSWAGLSGRYERAAQPDTGPRGQVRTRWDQLSDGSDPTLVEGQEPT